MDVLGNDPETGMSEKIALIILAKLRGRRNCPASYRADHSLHGYRPARVLSRPRIAPSESTCDSPGLMRLSLRKQRGQVFDQRRACSHLFEGCRGGSEIYPGCLRIQVCGCRSWLAYF